MTARNRNLGELVISKLSLTACLVPNDDVDDGEDEDEDNDDDDIPWELWRPVKKLWEENMTDSDSLRKLATSTSRRMTEVINAMVTNALISRLIIICKTNLLQHIFTNG